MKPLVTLTLSTYIPILLPQMQTKLKLREAQVKARSGKTARDLVGLEIVTIFNKKG